MSMYNVQCKKCGASRDRNLTKPCSLCGSRQIPLIGYTYGLEWSQVVKMLIAIAILIFLGLIAAAIYLTIKTLSFQAFWGIHYHFAQLIGSITI